MSLKIDYHTLRNLSTDEFYSKRITDTILMVEIGEQSLCLEMAHITVALNNSFVLNFVASTENQRLKVALTCKVTNFTNHDGLSRIELRLMQYNKKDWEDFLALVNKKQKHCTELLAELRCRCL